MSDLEARIAEVLGTHTPEVIYYNAEEGHVSCHGCDWTGASFSGFYDHQAAMLAPVIREREAAAWAEGRSACDREWSEITSGVSAHDMGSAHETPNPYRSNA